MVSGSELDVEKLLPERGITIPSPPSCIALPTASIPDVELQAREEQHWTKRAIVPFVVLTSVQFFTATYQTLSKVALTSGIDPFFFTFYRNMVAFLFLAPFAYYLER